MNNLNKWELNTRKIAIKQYPGEPFINLLVKNESKAGFDYSDDSVIIPTVFQRYIGVDGDEALHYGKLYDLHNSLLVLKDKYLFIDKGLDKKLDNSLVSKLQGHWQDLETRGQISAASIINNVISPYLSAYKDLRQKDQAVDKIKTVIEFYLDLFGTGKLYELKNIIFHLLHWHNLYLPKLFNNYDYLDINPKILFYGKISKREVYFLHLLYQMGVDIFYFNSAEDRFFTDLDKNNKISQLIEFPRRLEEKPFPLEKSISTISTEAQKATEELRETLHSDDSFFFKPWQFISYELNSKVMHSTYEEIAIFAKEEAKMRTGWNAGQGRVTLSNFFTLVKGIHKDEKRYWKELNELISLDMTLFIDSLPVLVSSNELRKKEYYETLNSEHVLDQEKLLKSGFWPYKRYPDHVQKFISSKMVLLCQLKGIKRDKSIPIEIQKIKVFNLLMNIPEKCLQLLQQFDFPAYVPKVVVYNNEQNGDMTLEDATLFYFMASSGIDTFIFNPSGHNDVETYLDDDCFDKHHLEKLAFNLAYKSRSLLGRFF